MEILNLKDFSVENPFKPNNELDMIIKSSINNVKKEEILNNSLFNYFPVTKEIKINNEKFEGNIFIKESEREMISVQFNNFDIIDDLKLENLDNYMDNKKIFLVILIIVMIIQLAQILFLLILLLLIK